MFAAASKHIRVAPSGAWAAVTTEAGTIHHINVSTLTVVLPALAIHGIGSSSCSSLSILADDCLVGADGAGMLEFVHLHPRHGISQSAPSTTSALMHGVHSYMTGPGGQTPALGGILQMGACLMDGRGVVETAASSAGSLAEGTVAELRQVWCHDRATMMTSVGARLPGLL
jgi:hypothetical protein